MVCAKRVRGVVMNIQTFLKYSPDTDYCNTGHSNTTNPFYEQKPKNILDVSIRGGKKRIMMKKLLDENGIFHSVEYTEIWKSSLFMNVKVKFIIYSFITWYIWIITLRCRYNQKEAEA